RFDLVLQIAGAADGGFRIEAQRVQSVGHVVSKRRREIQPDNQHAARTFDLFRQLDQTLPVEIRLQYLQIFERFVQRMIDVVGDAALLSRRSFQGGVRSDPRDEVLPQVGGKLGEAL